MEQEDIKQSLEQRQEQPVQAANVGPESQPQFHPNPADKPDNNLVLAIVCTACCCLPLGIVGIIKACKVNTLWISGQYDAAIYEANEAKKWSIWGIVLGLVGSALYVLIAFLSAFASR